MQQTTTPAHCCLLGCVSQWQVNDQGYPWVLGHNDVVAGQKIIITTREDAVADGK
jgi:hypothetical protein